jgi:hypothetical protein
MISSDALFWLTIGSLLGIGPVILAAAIFRWRMRRRLAAAEAFPPEELDLDRLPVRDRLQKFLRKHGITGSCDIREGWVFAPVPPERLEPLALMFLHTFSVIGQTPNAVNGNLYYAVKREGQGTGWSYHATDVTVEDLREAYTALSRVVEDRRKSRSLYKGLTDKELTSLVRTGLSCWYKDDGEFPDSVAAMQGTLDDSREFQIAKLTLELAFQIKRPEL